MTGARRHCFTFPSRKAATGSQSRKILVARSMWFMMKKFFCIDFEIERSLSASGIYTSFKCFSAYDENFFYQEIIIDKLVKRSELINYNFLVEKFFVICWKAFKRSEYSIFSFDQFSRSISSLQNRKLFLICFIPNQKSNAIIDSCYRCHPHLKGLIN